MLTLPTATPAASPAPTPSAAKKSVTVVSGDTLTAIAVRTGVDGQKIATLNNVASPDVLQIGQVLVLE